MVEVETPDTATLRELAAKHKIDPRTILTFLRTGNVRGKRAREAARAAVNEWRKTLFPPPPPVIERRKPWQGPRKAASK